MDVVRAGARDAEKEGDKDADGAMAAAARWIMAICAS